MRKAEVAARNRDKSIKDEIAVETSAEMDELDQKKVLSLVYGMLLFQSEH